MCYVQSSVIDVTNCLSRRDQRSQYHALFQKLNYSLFLLTGFPHATSYADAYGCCERIIKLLFHVCWCHDFQGI